MPTGSRSSWASFESPSTHLPSLQQPKTSLWTFRLQPHNQPDFFFVSPRTSYSWPQGNEWLSVLNPRSCQKPSPWAAIRRTFIRSTICNKYPTQWTFTKINIKLPIWDTTRGTYLQPSRILTILTAIIIASLSSKYCTKYISQWRPLMISISVLFWNT